MKKIILFITLFCSLFLLSSCQSDAEKVEKLVYDEFKQFIYDIDLYTIEAKQREDNMYKYYVYFTSIDGDCSCIEVSYLESLNDIIIGDNCDCYE